MSLSLYTIISSMTRKENQIGLSNNSIESIDRMYVCMYVRSCMIHANYCHSPHFKCAMFFFSNELPNVGVVCEFVFASFFLLLCVCFIQNIKTNRTNQKDA